MAKVKGSISRTLFRSVQVQDEGTYPVEGNVTVHSGNGFMGNISEILFRSIQVQAEGTYLV